MPLIKEIIMRYRWDGKTWVPRDELKTQYQSPGFISDAMDATAHPCNGKIYDSKSAFRKVTRAYGCEEMGNDKKYYFGD